MGCPTYPEEAHPVLSLACSTGSRMAPAGEVAVAQSLCHLFSRSSCRGDGTSQHTQLAFFMFGLLIWKNYLYVNYLVWLLPHCVSFCLGRVVLLFFFFPPSSLWKCSARQKLALKSRKLVRSLYSSWTMHLCTITYTSLLFFSLQVICIRFTTHSLKFGVIVLLYTSTKHMNFQVNLRTYMNSRVFKIVGSFRMNNNKSLSQHFQYFCGYWQLCSLGRFLLPQLESDSPLALAKLSLLEWWI